MTAGKDYARALYMLAEESDKEDEMLRELNMLSGILSENREYINILDTPSIPKADKLSLLDEAFGTVDVDILSFMKLLTEHREAALFPSVVREYSALYDEAHGIVRVEAVSAVPLSDDECDKIAAKLSGVGKRIIVKNTVDPEILGGLKLRYLGVQLDGSLKTRLDKLSEGLKNVIV